MNHLPMYWNNFSCRENFPVKAFNKVKMFFLLWAFFLLINQDVRGQACTADFSIMPDTTNALTFYFTDASTGTPPFIYNWDFGDATTATVANPTHVYLVGGVYPVCLTITDANSCTPAVPTCYTVNAGCDIYASYSLIVDTLNYKKYSFTNTSYSNMNITKKVWNFNDGSPIDTVSLDPIHTFPGPGYYDVCLKLYNSQGCTSLTCQQIYVACNIQGYFSYMQDTISNYKKFSFYDMVTSGVPITSRKWTFGDGTPVDTTLNPMHIYANVGSYEVCLTVTDAQQCTLKYCEWINVGCNIYAGFNHNLDTTINTKVFFNDGSYSNSSLTKRLWKFGDGTADSNIATNQNPVHVYSAKGSYEVCLGVINTQVCSSYTCYWINVGCELNAGFYFTQDTVNYKKLYFTDASWSNVFINKRIWNFGDGSPVDLTINPTHTYTSGGWYEVSLTVINNQACTSKTVNWINADCPLYGSFTFLADTLNMKTINFSDASSSSGTITSREWDFGDGTPVSTLANLSHTYANTGYFNVCLKVKDSKACSTVYCDWIHIGYNCETYFTATPDTVGTGVKFMANTSNIVSDIFWNFGDQTTANGMSAYHFYATAGWYYVCVSGYDSISGCSNTNCYWVEAGNSSSCAAYFGFKVNSVNNAVYFSDSSMGNLAGWYWDFGDGTFGYSQNPFHLYASTGFYHVTLTVWDTLTGCQNSFSEMVYIEDPNACFANFSQYPDSTTVYFYNYSYGNYTDVNWDFGDGNGSQDLNPVHTYPTGGYYWVTLTIYDTASGCVNSFTELVAVDITNPTFYDCVAGFSYYSDPSTDDVYFYNNSYGNYTDFYWDFGDGNTSDDNDPVHVYGYPGYFNVCMSVWDSVGGCYNYYCDVVTVYDTTVPICYADFTYYPDTSTGFDVYFEDLSVGNLTDYYWEFGDGYTSGDASPWHAYGYPGYYYVCLSTYDSISGCQNYLCKYIEIYDPNYIDCYAHFTSVVDTSTHSAYFSNNSGGSYTDVYWDLGDGNVSTDWEPVHTYTDPGYYWVCLTVWDSTSGCSEYFCDEVIINDPLTTMCYAHYSYYVDANTVYLNNESYGDFTDLYWEFGDGVTSNDYSPEYTYTDPGYYQVCLMIYDSLSGCQEWYCDFVQIGEDSAIVYDCNAFYHYVADITTNTVNFTNASVGSFTDFWWDFGDGETSYDDDPAHTFLFDGYYNVCLTVYDSVTGCCNCYCQIIQIGAASTADCFAYFNHFVDASGDVYFSNESQGDYTDVYWEFGDGTVSNDVDPVHVYAGPGYYYVCLSVFDSASNCLNAYCDWVQIYDATGGICEAIFVIYPDSGTNTVYLLDQSFGAPDYWYWDFGDGSLPSNDQSPTYTYAEPGIYEVCLWTYNTLNGCFSYYCKPIVINGGGNDCYAQFSYYADSVTATGHFENTSLGYISGYEWDFGDGVTSVQKNPSHTYSGVGVYGVCLTTYNDSGCATYYCDYVNIGNDLQDKCLFSCVWPGDANDDLEANHYDILPVGLNYNETGPIRDSVSIRWIGHFAQDWSTSQIDGVNNKNGDCNGDGVINLTDITAVDSNFAFSHAPQFKQANPANPDLYFEIVTPNVAPGSDVEVKVLASKDVDVSMYGIGFEFKMDPNIVDMATPKLSYDTCWVGQKGSDLITFGLVDPDPLKGLIYGSLVRNNKANKTGKGEIARLTFTIKSTAPADFDLGLVLTTKGAINATGDSVPFNGDSGSVTPGFRENMFAEQSLTLYPNPSKGTVAFELPVNNEGYEISVLNVIGEEVFNSTNYKGGKSELNLNQLESGVYMFTATSDKAVYRQKLQITK